MVEILGQFDSLLDENGPAAITLRQWLRPVGDPVIFPPTYANPSQRKGDPPVYNIDYFGETASLGRKFERFKGTHTFTESDRVEGGRIHSVCVMDNIPSQANRIEPVFGRLTNEKGDPSRLVPQARVSVKLGSETVEIDLLVDAGHRAADAIVRMSKQGTALRSASLARTKGDSLPLAKLAPTSLVFGMWDSQKTGVKVPRLVTSMIRAFDVREYRRSAQFNAAIDYEKAGVDMGSATKDLSAVGMDSAPAVFQRGGIEALGGICREAALNLCTLRDLAARSKSNVGGSEFTPLSGGTEIKLETLKLQRYILGLALVALTYFDGRTMNLRQGCQLVNVAEKPMVRKLVHSSGEEQDLDLSAPAAIEYAWMAARAFGVGPDWENVAFDPEMANQELGKGSKDKEPGDVSDGKESEADSRSRRSKGRK